MQPAVGAAKAEQAGAGGQLRMCGEDLVTHEHVAPAPPRGVGAPNEAGAADRCHVAIERLEVVLVLRNELRVLGAPAAHAVADIENDEPVVPVAEVGQAILHVDVVQHPAGGAAGRFPARHLLRGHRVADVDDAHRAGGVVGQVHVARGR